MSQAQTADPIPEAPADKEVDGVALAFIMAIAATDHEYRAERGPKDDWLFTCDERINLSSVLREALRRSTETDKPGVREAALEEAAKVAETITQDGDYDLEPEATVAASVAGKQIATAIRALRTPPASPTEAGEATTSLPDPALTDAIEWLETNQRQLDQDGIEVAVSRQALEQVLAALKDRSHV